MIEITDLDMILNYLETTSLEPHDDYTSEITYKDQKILYKHIKELQQENQQLRIQISAREEEYRKLENNWNELKNWLDNVIDYINHKEAIDASDIEEKITLINIINKMQELERSKQDDK